MMRGPQVGKPVLATLTAEDGDVSIGQNGRGQYASLDGTDVCNPSTVDTDNETAPEGDVDLDCVGGGSPTTGLCSIPDADITLVVRRLLRLT